MKLIKKLETKIERWLGPLPHLPTSARKWIAQNIWWLVIIVVAILVIGISDILGNISIIVFQVGLGGYGPYLSPFDVGLFIFYLIISLAFMVAMAILIVMAINPLKALQKKGWNLLFCVLVLRAIAVVIDWILTLNPVDFIWSMIIWEIGIAIGAYLLYEIRSYFSLSVKSKTISQK